MTTSMAEMPPDSGDDPLPSSGPGASPCLDPRRRPPPTLPICPFVPLFIFSICLPACLSACLSVREGLVLRCARRRDGHRPFLSLLPVHRWTIFWIETPRRSTPPRLARSRD
uniref:Uncharacterized protein n=1 Tax=Chrysocystis fragilis TaxID=1411660 RepID=A0A7S0XQY2_9STRA